MNQSSEGTISPAKSSLRALPASEAMFEFGVDDQSWPRGRQIEGNEGIDLLAADGHGSYRPALRFGIWRLAPRTLLAMNVHVPCRPAKNEVFTRRGR